MSLEGERRSSNISPADGGSGTVFSHRAPLRTSETVINLERRAAAEGSSQIASSPNSSLCRILFPTPEAGQLSIPNPEGVELGHFKIQNAIRSGGMGAVFQALDTRLNRLVALKILPPSQSTDLPSVQRFRHEAQAAAQLDHDNIARVYYIGEDQGLHFIAFEFIRGTNLREIVAHRGRLPVTAAVNYTLQVASAIAHAAAHGVIHRDIKPSNIIVTPSGRAKLVDLGLARSEHRAQDADLTLAGTTLGTFDYISPEQAKDPRSVDVRADIYSLGCTLYHLLVGEPPYPQGTVLQKLLDHQGKDAPDPRLKNRKVSSQLSAIVRTMMASDPRRRYQTAEELIRDLLIEAQALGLQGVSSESLMWLAARNKAESLWDRHASWIVTAVGLLVIVGYLQFGNSVRDRSNPQSTLALTHSPFDPHGEGKNSEPGDVVNKPIPIEIATDSSVVDSQSITSSQNSPKSVEPLETETVFQQSGRLPVSSANQISGSATAWGPPLVPIPPSRILEGPTDPRNIFSPLPPEVEFTPTPLVGTVAPRGIALGPLVDSRSDRIISRDLENQNSGFAAGNEGAVESSQDSESTNSKSSSNTTTAVAAVSPNVSKPPETKVVSETIASSPIVIIRSDGSKDQAFPTLEAACAVAEDGNIIELRFNGIRTESPIRIRNKITIRGARGYRPVIEFVSKEVPASGYETHMITVNGGALDLLDVSVFMTTREGLETDGWSMVSAQRLDVIRMQRVAVTVQNVVRRPVSLVEFRGGNSRMMSDMEMMSKGPMNSTMSVRLADCMIRGTTDLFSVRSSQSTRIDVENCLLALDGSLLKVQGASDVPEKEPVVSVRLSQLTAVLSNGLIVMESGDSPRRLPKIEMEASNNILTTIPNPALKETKLISFIGSEPVDDLRKIVSWNGQRNIYDGFQAFWSAMSLDSSSLQRWDFQEWQNRWESNELDPEIAIVIWRRQWSDRKFETLTPEDFALDETAIGNPALFAANNGENAGVDLTRLEKLDFTTSGTLAPNGTSLNPTPGNETLP